MSMSVCVNLQGAVVVILYAYVYMCPPTGGSGGNLACLCLFVSTYRGQWLKSCKFMSVCVNLQGAVVVILYVYVCLCQPTGGSGGNLVCLCLFVSTYRGQWW